MLLLVVDLDGPLHSCADILAEMMQVRADLKDETQLGKAVSLDLS